MRGESGQSLVIVAGVMLVMLAFTAFAIDVSLVLLARHRAQVAADTAALSAAQDLTGGTTNTTQDSQAANDGTTVATDNDPNASVQVTAPYGGVDATSARAVVSQTVSLPFASALGLSTTVSATAVAQNNLVINGSFNGNVTNNFIEYCAADGVTSISSGPFAFSCSSQNASMNGWTVYSGGVDLNTSSYITPPAGDPSTAQSVDLVGSCNYDASTYSCVPSGSCPSTTLNGGSANVDNTTSDAGADYPNDCQTNGEIYEPLNTLIGGTYSIKFDLSANSYGGPTNKLVSVWVSAYNPTTYGLENATLLTPYDPSAGQNGPLVGTANNWTSEPSTAADPLTFTATATKTYLWFVSNEGCVANNAAGTKTAPNIWTAVAPNCRYGAAITDVSVSGPDADNLTQ